jgi:hypothetical protein
MLPQAQTDTTNFSSFDEARSTIEALVPMQTRREALDNGLFGPIHHPNTTVLNHGDVVRRFVPTGLLTREDLDPGILRCIEARDACSGMEMVSSHIERARTGNFFTDFSNFRRQTETRGWRFNAIVLLVNDIVVYRTWGGQPVVHEIEVSTNPLGPLQDMGISRWVPIP